LLELIQWYFFSYSFDRFSRPSESLKHFLISRYAFNDSECPEQRRQSLDMFDGYRTEST
jgi:hypothetical protein